MPEKPPKEWFDTKVKEVKEGNPSYSDEVASATVGSIWYNQLSQSKKDEILSKESSMTHLKRAIRMLKGELIDEYPDGTPFGGEFDAIIKFEKPVRDMRGALSDVQADIGGNKGDLLEVTSEEWEEDEIALNGYLWTKGIVQYENETIEENAKDLIWEILWSHLEAMHLVVYGDATEIEIELKEPIREMKKAHLTLKAQEANEVTININWEDLQKYMPESGRKQFAFLEDDPSWMDDYLPQWEEDDEWEDEDDEDDDRETEEAFEERRYAEEAALGGRLWEQYLGWMEQVLEDISPASGSIDASHDEKGNFTITITDPNGLFQDIIHGVGIYDVSGEDFTDPELAKSHLGHLTSYYEVYGDRPPTFDPSF